MLLDVLYVALPLNRHLPPFLINDKPLCPLPPLARCLPDNAEACALEPAPVLEPVPARAEPTAAPPSLQPPQSEEQASV